MIATPGRLTPTFPPELEGASLEELLAAGWCDCRRPLEGHPPLPEPEAWGGWKSQRITPPEYRSGSSAAIAGARRPLTNEEIEGRRRFAGKVVSERRLYVP